MLRRNSSKNKNRRPLSRSKSTNSISTTRSHIRSLDFIDPDVAERDALTAAKISYHRAHGEAMPRKGQSLGLSEGESVRQSPTRSDSATARQDLPPGPGLHRQQSIRFAGPSAPPRRKLASRASDNRDFASRPLHVRPTSTLSYSTRESDVSSLTGGCIESVKRPNPGNDNESLQLAHRKVRKAKSMFMEAGDFAVDYYFNNGTPEHQAHQLSTHYASLNKENEPPRASTTPSPRSNGLVLSHRLRAPKSMGFLRGRRERAVSSQASSRAENDLAVQLAHETFRQQIEQQSQSKLKSHPSMFLRSRNKRSDHSSTIRRSMRDSSIDSTAFSSVFSVDAVSISKQPGLRRTARKVSNSLKSKLKGFFSRSKVTESTYSAEDESDVQPVSDVESASHVDDHPPPEVASVSCIQSRVPSLHAVPSSQQLNSRQGSLGSISSAEHQNSDDRSRVTSWTDSITNTVTSQGTIGDKERARLSVIQENGTHASSSTPRPLAVYNAEMPLNTPLVNSERVFSALMKRLNEAKKQEKKKRNESIGDIRAHGIAPPRGSSVDQSGAQDDMKTTIRCVRSDDDVFQDEILGNSERVALPLDHETKPGVQSADYDPMFHSDSKSLTTNMIHNHDPFVEGQPQRAHSVRSQSTTIPQRTSAFFGSPSCHLFRTTSPYRRALQDHMKEIEQSDKYKDLSRLQLTTSLSGFSLPPRRPSTAGSDKDPCAEDADSIYSSTPENIKPCNSQAVKPVTERCLEPPRTKSHGAATIFIDEPPRWPVAAHLRDVSSASSVEWKTWLSAKVSKLETSEQSSASETQAETPYTLPRLGHVREKADIGSWGDAQSPSMWKPIELNERNPLNQIEGNGRLNKSSSNKVSDCSNHASTLSNVLDTLASKEMALEPTENDVRTTLSLPPIRSIRSTLELRSPKGRSKIPYIWPSDINTPTGAENSRVLLKRRSRACDTGASVQSSPSLTTAVRRQFGVSNTGSPEPKLGRTRNDASSRIRLVKNPSIEATPDAGSTTSVLGPEEGASKRMVDRFLSSRRQRMQSLESEGETAGESAAFL